MTQKFDRNKDAQELGLGTEFNYSNLSNELLFKYNKQTSTFFLNRKASDLTPLFSSTNKVLLQKLLDVIHSEDKEKFNIEFGNYIKEDSGDFESDIKINIEEEQYKCFRIKAKSSSDVDPLHIHGKIEDISDEIERNTKMLEIEQKYKHLKNLLSHGILLTDDTGKIIEWNNWLSRFTGIDESKAIGAYYWDIRYKLLPESERNKTDEMQYINYIKSIFSKNDPGVFGIPSRMKILTVNGFEKFAEQIFYNIEICDKEHFLIVLKDITANISLENDLQKIDKHLGEVLNYTKTIHYKQNYYTGKYEYISRYVEKMLGYKVSEIDGLNIEDISKLIHPSDIDVYLKDHSALNKQDIVTEYRFKTKGGDYKYLSDYHRLIFDENDEPLYVVGNIRDITLQKKYEEELEDSREKYKILVENINDLVVKVDVEGRILYASPNYCHLFGEKLENLIGRKYIYLVHEEDREKTSKAIDQLYCAPHTCYLEQRAWTSFGWRWLAWSDRAVLDDEGNLVEIIGVGRDITKRKRMEAAVKKSENDYRGLFENAMSAIIIFEPNQEIVLDANDRACQMYGYTKDEFIGLSLEEVSKDINKGKKEISNTLNIRKNHKFETIHYDRLGRELYLEINASLIDFADSQVILSINHDISRYKQLEKECEEDRMLSELCYNGKHTASVIINEDMKIIKASDKMSEIFGYAKVKLFELSLKALLAAEDKDKLSSILLDNGNSNQRYRLIFQNSSRENIKTEIDFYKMQHGDLVVFNVDIHPLNS